MSIWGKIIGGTAGFALGGPLGAILGMMAGNVFDKSKKNNIFKKIFSIKSQIHTVISTIYYIISCRVGEQ